MKSKAWAYPAHYLGCLVHGFAELASLKVGARVAGPSLGLGSYLDLYQVDFHLVIGVRGLIPMQAPDYDP